MDSNFQNKIFDESDSLSPSKKKAKFRSRMANFSELEDGESSERDKPA